MKGFDSSNNTFFLSNFPNPLQNNTSRVAALEKQVPWHQGVFEKSLTVILYCIFSVLKYQLLHLSLVLKNIWFIYLFFSFLVSPLSGECKCPLCPEAPNCPKINRMHSQGTIDIYQYLWKVDESPAKLWMKWKLWLNGGASGETILWGLSYPNSLVLTACSRAEWRTDWPWC